MNRNDGSQADWSSAPITMGGSNAEDISIPSVMISSTDGTRLKSRLLNNQTINVSLSLKL